MSAKRRSLSATSAGILLVLTGAAEAGQPREAERRSSVRAVEAGDLYVADYIVAKVNDEIITRRDVEEALTSHLPGFTPAQRQQGQDTARHVLAMLDALAEGQTIASEELLGVQIVLQDLVDRTLFRQVASHQLGEGYIDSVRAAVQRYFRRTQKPQDLDHPESIKRQTRVEMDRRIFEALLSRNISVGRHVIRPAEIRVFFDSHLDDFRQPASVSFRHIMIRAEATGPRQDEFDRMLALRDRLVGGADFARLAREHSDGPRAGGGGLWSDIDPTVLLPEMENQLTALPLGRISEVFKTRQGCHVVQVLKRRDGGLRDFSDVQSDIQDYLYMKLLDGAIRDWLKEKSEEAYVWTLLDLHGVVLHR